MKRPYLTIFSRLALLGALLGLILAHESYRGIITHIHGSEAAVPDDPASVRVSTELSVGIPDALTAASLLVSNGGFARDASSWYAKQNLSMRIEKKEDPTELVRGFVSGRYDIIALSPDRFAALYPSLSPLHPVAFLQSGSASGPTVIAAKEKLPSIASLRKKRISCVEKSQEHFLLLYLLRENNIHPRDITWVFTLTGDDAVRLFECGKSDIVACQTGSIRRKVPSSAQILFSTAGAPDFCRFVLIAKESDIVVRPGIFRTLAAGAFEARKTILSMNDADAAAFVKKCGVTADGLKGNPAAIMPSLDDNLSFFRMTAARSWDYALEYQTARELYSIPAESEGVDISSTQNTIILDMIDRNAYASKGVPSVAPSDSGSGTVLFPIEIPFAKNGLDPAYPSRLPLSRLIIAAKLFPAARIMTRGNAAADETNSAWLAGAREAALRDAVAKLDSSVAQRLFPSGDKPSQNVSVTLTFASAAAQK